MLPILLVDDAREDLMLAQVVLRQCKILNPVHLMTTGDECIRFFRKEWSSDHGELSAPCLAFIDLAMYPTSGIQTISAISQTLLFSESLIVMVSGIQDIKLVRQGYQLGARTFLVKPLTCEDIMSFLATVNDRLQVEKTPEGYALNWIPRVPAALDLSPARETSRVLSMGA